MTVHMDGKLNNIRTPGGQKGSDCLSTPWDFFRLLDEEFHFDLDVCASSESTKCENYFDSTQNGLTKLWSGTCFCNPPYSQIAEWVEKATTEAKNGRATTVMLLPVRTDTKWFHRFIYQKHEVRFIRGRLKFGGLKGPAPFASMIVIIRANPAGTIIHELMP